MGLKCDHKLRLPTSLRVTDKVLTVYGEHPYSFSGLAANRFYVDTIGLGDEGLGLRFRFEYLHDTVVDIQDGILSRNGDRTGADMKRKTRFLLTHGVAALSVSAEVLKNFWHEWQNQLPGFGPLGISLNLRHVAASRMVIPTTPTCTDAVSCEPHCVQGGTSICVNLS